MRILKIILSVLALVVSAAAGVLTTGSPVQVAPQALALVMAIAGAVSILGISPAGINATVAQGLRAAAVVMTGIVGWHATAVTVHANAHPFVWAGFAFAAAVVGVLGKSPIPHAPPAPKPDASPSA